MDYEYYYNNARSRYGDACSQINACENRIAELKNQRKRKVDQIVQLNADLKSHRKALEDVEKALTREEPLRTDLAKVSENTDVASTGYGSMVTSSADVSKNLTQVYAAESQRTHGALNSVVDDMKAKKRGLQDAIVRLERELASAQRELEDIDGAVKTAQNSLSEWKRAKNSASYDMEYYRRMMQKA